MGIILSRYRKKKNAEQQLEDIEKEIVDIENNKQYAVQREKYIVWRLFIYSFLLYISSAILFYVYFFPASLRDQIFYMIPLLIFPGIIVLVKKCITWIYTRKITKNRDKLTNLRKKKKEILDDVMNTETYKVAKQILDKYAPEQVKKPTSAALLTSSVPLKTPKNKPAVNMGSAVMVNSGGRRMVQPINMPIGPSNTPLLDSRSYISPSNRPIIRPLFPQERTYIDRVIDALIGDGPNNRYALICKNCASHNGMAVKEEFDHLAFRCAYCGFPNPSLKTKLKSSLLSLDYPSSTSSTNETSEDKSSELNNTNENSTSADDSQQSGVEITEVTDILPESNEGITHRKNNAVIITEEIVEPVEENLKKTQ